ncbi:MAG: histidine phosphatase family protein, partial [Lachnospiraceae bacterium]|nr:histidine phosphatase family protein [Lachnospiraceae bacterium]
KYKDINIDICYCSPLSRALETARIFLQGRDVPIVTDERLKEMSFGIYEGSERVLEKDGHPLRALFAEPEKYVVPAEGGESFDELFARTGEFLDEVITPAIEAGSDVLIVGHGAMNTSIICRMRKIPLKDFWSVGIEQCTLTKLI